MDTLYTVLLLLGIVLMLLLLFLIYSGLLHPIDIKIAPSPYERFLVCYKFSTGPYEGCGKVFQQVSAIAPRLRCFGIYYDDPDTVAAADLRWAVGSILAEGDEKPDAGLQATFEANGFKVTTLPKVNRLAMMLFPYKNRVSMFIAIYRVWKAIGEYIKKTDCEADPWMDIYDSEHIHFLGIMDHHQQYYVEEARKLEEQRVAKATAGTE